MLILVTQPVDKFLALYIVKTLNTVIIMVSPSVEKFLAFCRAQSFTTVLKTT
jgi:hypothetical protein